MQNEAETVDCKHMSHIFNVKTQPPFLAFISFLRHKTEFFLVFTCSFKRNCATFCTSVKCYKFMIREIVDKIWEKWYCPPNFLGWYDYAKNFLQRTQNQSIKGKT